MKPFFDNVLIEHGGLPHVLTLAVHLEHKEEVILSHSYSLSFLVRGRSMSFFLLSTCLSKQFQVDSKQNNMEQSTMFSENIINLTIIKMPASSIDKINAERTICRSSILRVILSVLKRRLLWA